MGRTNVQLPEDLIAQLERMAEKAGETRASYVTNAVKMLLKEKEEKSKKPREFARFIEVLRRDLNYARKAMLRAKAEGKKKPYGFFMPEELKRDAKVLAVEMKANLSLLVMVALWRRMAKEAAIEAK